MSLTTDLVKKLILEYIGGKPLIGNPGNAWAGKHLITVQIPHLGSLGGLTGALGKLVNEASSVSSALSKLVNNPLSALTGQVSSLAGGVLSQAAAIPGLSAPLLGQITSAVSTLQTSANNFLNYTNILSGVTNDAESIGSATLGIHELMQVPDASDIKELASSLFSDNQVTAIKNSLDPTVLGGASDTLNLITNSTTVDEQQQHVNTLTKQLTDHAAKLDAIVASDTAAQSKFITSRIITNFVHGLLPDRTAPNSGQEQLFNRVASPTLKTILSQYPDDVRDPDDQNLAIFPAEK